MNEPVQSEARGRIGLICGCMFSGKSERLVVRIADAQQQSKSVVAFKHADDARYAKGQIVTHSGWRADAYPVASASRMLELAKHAQLVVIDEAQFFGNDLVGACQQWRERGQDVVVAGLDFDAWGEPFGPIPALETIADEVTRTYAVCAVCSAPADHTQRIAPFVGQKMVGGAEAYEPRCAKCFQPPPIERRR